MFSRHTKLFEIFVIFAIMFTLQGCAAVTGYTPAILPGQVLPLSNGSTIAGMQNAINGGLDTFMMTKDAVVGTTTFKDGLLMLGWVEKGCGGWCFVLIDQTKQEFLDQTAMSSVKGNLVAGKDLTTLTDYLKNVCGWKPLVAAEVSTGLRTAVMSAGTQNSWITLANRVPVLMIVFDAPQTDPFYTIRTVQQ